MKINEAKRWCNGWCMAAFWLSFFIFLVLVTVPLCMLTFYNLQFFWQALLSAPDLWPTP